MPVRRVPLQGNGALAIASQRTIFTIWVGNCRWSLPLPFTKPPGFVAHHLGDNTAWERGRVTFNLLKHIEPFGTVLLPTSHRCTWCLLHVRLGSRGGLCLYPVLD
jgi:hypothetical protein